MSGIWDRIRAFFRRKKEPTAEPGEALPEIELTATNPAPKPVPKAAKETERAQKACPKCGAPNDTFVHKCWLCKTEV